MMTEGGLEQYRLSESLGSMPSSQVVAIGVIAIALAVYRQTWNVVGYPVTIVHELGHAIAALLMGYRLHGITVNGDMSGATSFSGHGTARVVWTMWWGYPFPAVVGASLLWAVSDGWAKVALVVLVAALLLVFLLSRSVHTFLVVLVTGALLALIARYAEPWAQNAVVFAFAWLLLVGSVRAFWSVTKSHLTRRGSSHSDAYLMARRVRVVPAPVWLLTFALAIGAAAWFGVTTIADVLAVTLP